MVGMSPRRNQSLPNTMQYSIFALGIAAGLSLIARTVAQSDGSGPIVPGNPQVALQYGTFDPKVGTLPIPAEAREALLALTPASYVGKAAELARRC